MKKVKWKIFNLALWTEIILAYFLPFKISDSNQYKVGFPASFISVQGGNPGMNPFMSMQFNPLAFLINAIIIYFIMVLIMQVYDKYL